MLMTDLEQYLAEIVVPTLKDFEANPLSRRHAFLACVTACHAVDYLAYPNGPRKLREQFERQSSDFKIVSDVGHAFKHVVQGKRSDPRMKASEVISRPPGFYHKAVWDVSRWDDTTGGVTLENDRTIDVLEVARRAVAFLWDQVTAAQAQSVQSSPSNVA